MWDFPIQTHKTLEHNPPDITVIDKKNNKCIVKDLACPFETRTEKKEDEKYTNYSEVKYGIAKICKMKKVEVTAVVTGALGTVTKDYEKWIEKLDLDNWSITEALLTWNGENNTTEKVGYKIIIIIMIIIIRTIRTNIRTKTKNKYKYKNKSEYKNESS